MLTEISTPGMKVIPRFVRARVRARALARVCGNRRYAQAWVWLPARSKILKAFHHRLTRTEIVPLAVPVPNVSLSARHVSRKVYRTQNLSAKGRVFFSSRSLNLTLFYRMNPKFLTSRYLRSLSAQNRSPVILRTLAAHQDHAKRLHEPHGELRDTSISFVGPLGFWLI
jgi:hypothetical protein